MIFDSMDKNGFLPDTNCTRCNKPMDGIDGRYPAESYAGSYTGLCHRCQEESSYIVKEHFDLAVTRSYPPHCPSYRRDREEYTGYPDCNACNGAGRIYVSRPMAIGGPYFKHCDYCFRRFYDQPLRKKYCKLTGDIFDYIKDKYTIMFHGECFDIGIDPSSDDPKVTAECGAIAKRLILERDKEAKEMHHRLQTIYETSKTAKDGEEYLMTRCNGILSELKE